MWAFLVVSMLTGFHGLGVAPVGPFKTQVECAHARTDALRVPLEKGRSLVYITPCFELPKDT